MTYLLYNKHMEVSNMGKYDIYYSNIKDAKYHQNMELLSQIDGNNKFAIELGCGSGRDTIYLLKQRIQSTRN